MSRISGVYKITNTVNGKFYVGSSKDIERRVKAHFSGGGSLAITRAIAKYGIENLEYEILELCTEDDLLFREQYFIDTLMPQYNASRIAGRIEHTPEVRAKISEAQRQNWQSEELRSRYIANMRGRAPWNKGKTLPEQTRGRLSISHMGNKPSDETRAKMSITHQGRVFSEEARANMSAAQKGRVVSDEARTNMSAAARGNTNKRGSKLSDESRAKISVANKGRSVSAETRAKMSVKRRGEQNGNHKLTKAQVDEIRNRYIPRRISQRQLAAEFGVDQQVIWSIVNHKTWKDGR